MKNFKILAIIFSLLLSGSCQQGQKQPENYQARVCEELSQLDTKYFKAWDNENLDSVMFFFDKDFLNMFSYGPATNYQENVESLKNVFDAYSVEDVKYERIECFVDNKYAFETGLFEQRWISNDKEDTTFFKMRGLTVWRKQGDGTWKIFRLIAQQ